MFPHDRVSGFALMLGALLLAVAGCSDGETGSDPATGAARVEIATTRVNAGEITRVTVTASSGATVDLDRAPEGMGFVGALTLPVGPGELVGRAFIEEALVAESQPTPVVIEEGAVTSVMLRLFDLTGDDGPDYGPLIVSLVHPETAVASQPAQLSVMAVDPDGDAVTILWSSDCADASFSDPGASETQWVKSAEGACNITVTASAGGLSASETFRIVVFASGTGAVDIGGVIVPAPQIFLGLDYGARCEVFPGVANGSCPAPISSAQGASVSVNVSWGEVLPGTIEVLDDCGGSFQATFSDSFRAEGQWTPPRTTGVCMVRARASSPEGASVELAAAIVVRASDGACIPGTAQCDNCIDDDGDGLVDGFDPHCISAADNDESSFATGIPGDNFGTSTLDCFYDGNSGSGDDGCNLPSCCLLGTCAPGVDCSLGQQCISTCAPAAPPGCDCFGCCTVCNGPDCRDVLVYPALSPSCDLDSLDDPTACPVCQKATSCARPCEIDDTDCILCAGETRDDLPLACNGQNQCPGGDAPCDTSADCASSEYCSHGCCIASLAE